MLNSFSWVCLPAITSQLRNKLLHNNHYVILIDDITMRNLKCFYIKNMKYHKITLFLEHISIYRGRTRSSANMRKNFNSNVRGDWLQLHKYGTITFSSQKPAGKICFSTLIDPKWPHYCKIF